METDLRDAGFGEFVDFVFDHPVRHEDEEAEPAAWRDGERAGREWYWELVLWEFQVDPVRQVGHMARLLREPEVLAGRFTAAQVEQGFWFLLGPGGDALFLDHLWDDGVPWETRAEFFAATVPLFARLFDRMPGLDSAPFMLWDMLLGYRYHPERDDPPPTPDEERVRGAVIDALAGQLALGGPRSVPAAMHGVYHANHPAARALLRDFLARAEGLDPEWREYGEKVLCGVGL